MQVLQLFSKSPRHGPMPRTQYRPMQRHACREAAEVFKRHRQVETRAQGLADPVGTSIRPRERAPRSVPESLDCRATQRWVRSLFTGRHVDPVKFRRSSVFFHRTIVDTAGPRTSGLQKRRAFAQRIAQKDRQVAAPSYRANPRSKDYLLDCAARQVLVPKCGRPCGLYRGLLRSSRIFG